MRRFVAATFGVLTFAALAIAVLPVRAGAVDRSLGADVAKPVLGGVPWTSSAKARLAVDLDALLARAPTLRGAHVGLLALDTRSGEPLYAHNADDAFVPASTMKLLTGSVALAILGPQFRFHTDAYLSASRSQLVIRPGGDPLLGVSDLQAMARAVAAAGVAVLPAGVGIDASAFEPALYPPGWSWDDFPYDYAPPLSAAVVEENVIHLTVSPGRAAGEPALVAGAPAPFDHRFLAPIEGCAGGPKFDLIPLVTTVAAGTSAALDLKRVAGCIEVSGSIALDSKPQTLDAAIPDPRWYLRTLSEAALAGAGVRAGRLWVVAGSPGAITVLKPDGSVWTHDGEPLTDLLADMWWPSDNLIAEQLLKAIGSQTGGVPGTLDHGAESEREWLASIGVDPATLTIADGSGLSSYDRLTPRALAAILQADWNGPARDTVLADLPLAGVRGTLTHGLLGSLAERRTFAKTGSVNHTRGLAGYLVTLHHGAVTFAWSIDDWTDDDDAALDKLRAQVLSRIIGD